jgi:DNA replication and repair protein RecF
MALRRLQVTDFRCLQSVDIELDARFTLVTGANASGKTSLLEAIYLLGRGRSFRTRRLEHLIRRGAKRFVVFGELVSGERRIPVGLESADGALRARIAGSTPASLAELAVGFPVQVIDPEVHKLIEEGPSGRRRFLDWGVFHVEPNFMGVWQRFHQVLRQRNAALKARQARAVVSAWDSDLIRCGEELAAARARYVDTLRLEAQGLVQRLLGRTLELHYRSGWSKHCGLAEALGHSLTADQERGSTQVGPQRAELAIHLDGAPARDHVSRGHQKLLAAALLIAQINLFPAGAPARPSLLLDDPAAELDQERLAGLIAEVSSQANQLIVTTLHADFSAFGSPGRRFRIADGEAKAEG